MAPIQAQAFVQRGNKHVQDSVLVPEPGERELLVKVLYTAQNPVDVFMFTENEHVVGCDLVGIVEQVGSSAERFSPGTVVAGVVWAGLVPDVGAFSEYTVVDERYCFQIPNGTKYEEAATIPATSITSELALFSSDSLGLHKEACAGQTILIWGGSSSVGQYAIQIAASYGLIPVTTCSSRHHDHVKQLGAKHAFDYHDDDVIEKIQAVAPNLQYVFDTIGNKTSSVTASQAIRELGGVLCTVRPGKSFTKDVKSKTKVTDVYVWSMFNKKIDDKYFRREANESDQHLAFTFFEKLPSLLSEGKIRPNIPKLYENGFEDIPTGFQECREGKISNYKIVYKIGQAP